MQNRTATLLLEVLYPDLGCDRLFEEVDRLVLLIYFVL